MAPNHATSSAFLTVAQAAAHLNLSRTAIYELCATKQLEHFCVGADGKGIRIKPEELDAFIERRRVARSLPVEEPDNPQPRAKRKQITEALRLVHLPMPKALRA